MTTNPLTEWRLLRDRLRHLMLIRDLAQDMSGW